MNEVTTDGTAQATWQNRLRASLWRMFKIFMVIVMVFLILAGYGAYRFMDYSEPGISWDELTQAREEALPRLQAALNSYKQEHGQYPEALSELTARYIKQLPYELDPRDFGDLTYYPGHCEYCEPRIEYRQCLYPWRKCEVT